MTEPENQHLHLEVANRDRLSVRQFAVEERVSEPFAITVIARSPDASLDLDLIVGHPATFRIESGIAGSHASRRAWPGVVRAGSQDEVEPSGLSTYRFEIVPTLWLLTQRRDYRIVPHQSAPEIAAAILDSWGIAYAMEVDRTEHPVLPYKVQYAESDYAFFCRILEEAGISFSFSQGGTGVAVLTLSDALHAGKARSPAIAREESPNEAAEREFVAEVRLLGASRSGAYTIRDHDLRRPAYAAFAEANKASSDEAKLEQYVYRPGAFLVDTERNGETPIADADGAARHDDAAGARLSQRALDAERADRRVVAYRTNALDLHPGQVFTTFGHPHPELEGGPRLLATALRIEGAPGQPWTARGEAVRADQPFRPRVRTARPRARVQSATVVGATEIDADELGRVRVLFPWERNGSWSCWLRVGQAWAGADFGMLTLPRVGEEVLVDFLEGDPEQPVVVGRVFNATNPVVVPLPANETISAWKSNSLPGGGGYNELLFEDRAGSELVSKQSERDHRRLARNDETSTIGRDRRKLVSRSELETTGKDRTQETRHDRVELTSADHTSEVKGTRRDHVGRDAIERIEVEEVRFTGQDSHVLDRGVRRDHVERDVHLAVGEGRPERVGGTDSLIVGGALLETVGSYSVTAGGPIEGWIHHIAAKPNGIILIEADVEVTLKGAAGFVRIDPNGVTILGTVVNINESGAPGVLPGPGPRPPESPLVAAVGDPPPPREVTPGDPVVGYELVVVDELEQPIVGLAIDLVSSQTVSSIATDAQGRIRFDAPPPEASALIQRPEQLAELLENKEKGGRRTDALPEGDPWIVRTPTDLADAIVLKSGEARRLMVVTRTDLEHHAVASGWARRALTGEGPFHLESAEPVLLQVRSDATAAQAVVVGSDADHNRPAGQQEAELPAAPGAAGETRPEWLRTIVDSLHDALFKGRFDVVFDILANVPLDPPPPPRPAPPAPTEEKKAYEEALAALAAAGIVDGGEEGQGDG